jgi:hypothetical protein
MDVKVTNSFLIAFVLVFTLFCQHSVGAKVSITYKVDAGQWKTDNSVYVQSGKTVFLKFSVANAKTIHWYQIIPDVSQYYKNANFPWETDAYKWSGFGKIVYEKVALTEFENEPFLKITPDLLKENKPASDRLYQTNLGSFWFQAEAILKNGQVVKTAGLEDNDYRGLSPKVFRLSYIENTDYVGYLTSFFNVPGLFGSIPYQSKNYIGVDCADVLMATEAILKNKKLIDYNVVKVVNTFEKIASFEMQDGHPSQKLSWDKDFKKGDFIAVRYSPSRQFAHIGVLYRDENENKILDNADLVIHAGPEALHFSRLKTGGFDGFVKILRNRNR